jgi:hypothetical protein
MVNMPVACPGEISQVQFHRTIQPPLLRNPERGRKNGHLGYFSVTCRPIRRLNGQRSDTDENPDRRGANSAAFGEPGRARVELTVLKPTEFFGEMRAAAPSERPEEWLQSREGVSFGFVKRMS